MTALTQEFINDFVRRYAAAWTKKESASSPLQALVTEDVHWADPMLPQPGNYQAFYDLSSMLRQVDLIP